MIAGACLILSIAVLGVTLSAVRASLLSPAERTRRAARR